MSERTTLLIRGAAGSIHVLPDLARAYERAAIPDSAGVAYERFLAITDPERVHADAIHLGGALLRLAELYEGAGDIASAIETDSQLAELWRDADRELQPRVEAARQRVAALVERGGPPTHR